MSTFDWLRINNKFDFRMANRFAQRKFFKSFIAKDNYVRINEFTHPSPFQIIGSTNNFHFFRKNLPQKRILPVKNRKKMNVTIESFVLELV